VGEGDRGGDGSGRRGIGLVKMSGRHFWEHFPRMRIKAGF